jgi:hypothetical protein
MSTPILDPSLPADHSPLSSGEMRGQFQAIQDNSPIVSGAVFLIPRVRRFTTGWDRDTFNP